MILDATIISISGHHKSQPSKTVNLITGGLVYINNGDGSFTYCDHLFAGEAPVCDFGGAFGTDKIGNFNTNLWNSTDYADLTDTSGGSVSQNYITTNGELDEAYQRYVRENPW